MKPSKVNERTKGQVFINLYGKGFKKGQAVRMSKTKCVFSKDYEPKWTREIVYFKSVNKERPIHTYKVRNYKGNDILGTLYPQEQQAGIPPKTYKVEKVLRTR